RQRLDVNGADETGADDGGADLGECPHLRGFSHVPVAPRVALPCRRLVVRPARLSAPRDAVGDHALDLGLVVDRVLLVAWAEVNNPAQAAPVDAAAAKDLAPFVRADENKIVRGGDVEVLAVHLV